MAVVMTAFSRHCTHTSAGRRLEEKEIAGGKFVNCETFSVGAFCLLNKVKLHRPF